MPPELPAIIVATGRDFGQRFFSVEIQWFWVRIRVANVGLNGRQDWRILGDWIFQIRSLLLSKPDQIEQHNCGKEFEK
jgi:hypothetical protein